MLAIMEADTTFIRLRLEFPEMLIGTLPVKDIDTQPSKFTFMERQMREFKDEQVIENFKETNHRFYVIRKNQPLRIRKDEVLCCLNMRSTGYYHATRHNMEKNLKEQCMSWTE